MTHPHKEPTREEVARIEIGQTDITRPYAIVLSVVFLLLVASVAPIQAVRELSGEGRLQALRILTSVRQAPREFAKAGGGPLARTFAANRFLLKEINEYEDRLEENSFLEERLLPPMQHLLTSVAGLGNEQAYLGREGWLFYRPGIDYVMGPGFLEPDQLQRRAGSGSEWQAPPQPDPVRAILHFRDQLSERGIRLVLLPTAVKPTIHPEQMSGHYRGRTTPLQNASYELFLSQMEEAGILVLDPAPVLMETVLEERPEQFLKTDTHWRPETMDVIARGLAHVVRIVARQPSGEPADQAPEQQVTALGDIALMLKLPAHQRLFPEETVAIQPVDDGRGGEWKPAPDAEVLLLGDSFSNIYSDKQMQWGHSAGLAERLSAHMGQPVDAIVRNDAGAHATRQVLGQQIQGGIDRLLGKKVVVWQFAARELAVGDWKPIDLAPVERVEPRVSGFVSVAEGVEITVEGRIAEATPVPTPGTVPYKDHIRTLHLVNVRSADGSLAGDQAVVYVWSMRDNEWTQAAGLVAGDRVTLRLRSWYDVADELDSINKTELQDSELLLQELTWGELK